MRIQKQFYILPLFLLLVQCDFLKPIKKPEITAIYQTETNSYQLTMTAGKNSAIFYTVDGSDPSYQSTMYIQAVNLPEGTLVRAAAYCPSGRHSEIIEFQLKGEIQGKQTKSTCY